MITCIDIVRVRVRVRVRVIVRIYLAGSVDQVRLQSAAGGAEGHELRVDLWGLGLGLELRVRVRYMMTIIVIVTVMFIVVMVLSYHVVLGRLLGKVGLDLIERIGILACLLP
jgi:hypothetical protein